MKTVVINYEKNSPAAYTEKRIKAGILLSGNDSLQVWNLESLSDLWDKDTNIILDAILEVYEKEHPDLLILPDDNPGNILAGKLSKKMHRQAALHLINCYFDKEGYFHGDSLSYNGNLIASVTYHEMPLAVTISPSASAWDEVNINDEKQCFVTEKSVSCDFKESRFCDGMTVLKRQKISQKSDLTNAEIVFVCGRGVGQKNIAKRIKEIAKDANALVGGSRPAVIEGLADLDCLVGISGKVIAPQLCVLWGISGSSAFMTGVKGSKKIVAVNQDEDAPVFKHSDYGIVADCEMLASEIEKIYT